MKVYVDKSKLESHDIQPITDLGGKEFQQVRMWFENTENVEIKDLSDYTKQVRKEVCDGLALPLIQHFSKDAEFTVEEICKWIQEYKDQIQEQVTSK